MEIERKYLIDELPFDVTAYPSHEIEQAYLNTEPVVRIRRQDEDYYLTLNQEAYAHLLEKADGNVLTKTRYKIPLGDHLTIEIDVFHGKFEGLILAEVEFPTMEEAESFQPPEYFGKDVTFSTEYHNSTLSQK